MPRGDHIEYTYLRGDPDGLFPPILTEVTVNGVDVPGHVHTVNGNHAVWLDEPITPPMATVDIEGDFEAWLERHHEKERRKKGICNPNSGIVLNRKD